MTTEFERGLSTCLFLLTYIGVVGVADAYKLRMVSDLALFFAPLFMIWLDRKIRDTEKRKVNLLNLRTSWFKGIALAAIAILPFNLSIIF